MTSETTAAAACAASLPVLILGAFCPPVWIAIIPLAGVAAVASSR